MILLALGAVGCAVIWNSWGNYLFRNYMVKKTECSGPSTRQMLADTGISGEQGYINPAYRNVPHSQTAQSSATLLTGRHGPQGMRPSLILTL